MKVFVVFGTRPEAIKFLPLIQAFKARRATFSLQVCTTGQHRELVDQLLADFEIRQDHDLDIMRPNQTSVDIMEATLRKLTPLLAQERPDWVLVQGDTTSALAGTLAAFYSQIRVGHVEAGLRTWNKAAPFPEEINRVLIDHTCDYRFAPTEVNRVNLQKEGIEKDVYVVGNTIVDAIHTVLPLVEKKYAPQFQQKHSFLDGEKKLILATTHRRENFGEPLRNILGAFKQIAETHPEVQLVLPVHPNPSVSKVARETLKGISNISLIEPLGYYEFLWMMQRCYLLLTDSGGVQEEAPTFGKPLLVLRETTERAEGVDAGAAKLVGASKEKIIAETERLLCDPNAYAAMSKVPNPYGDGTSCKQILDLLEKS
ncbi:MAG: UDP-N-acetylglucosamine 2-epimerase (non-hydrolyzing) [Bdellovibrionaceae bacterium]|nr:UDP-N-acetylglucosamine 2-epimerase (non-hydrolyzing) [Bdellovibrionales bacterium]MCB9255298.1 UDP-N-acetylglucosamine 2-epimerase (non-hydrolyzing) [Pseudobdellovibrionaceae bacterium]